MSGLFLTPWIGKWCNKKQKYSEKTKRKKKNTFQNHLKGGRRIRFQSPASSASLLFPLTSLFFPRVSIKGSICTCDINMAPVLGAPPLQTPRFLNSSLEYMYFSSSGHSYFIRATWCQRQFSILGRRFFIYLFIFFQIYGDCPSSHINLVQNNVSIQTLSCVC